MKILPQRKRKTPSLIENQRDNLEFKGFSLGKVLSFFFRILIP